jgi:hypothetical protein
MIESMGYFLYNLAETHAKMKVIIEVLLKKSSKIKDERQKLLLENAYFSVVPMDEQEEKMMLQRRPPLEEYIIMKVITGSRPVGVLRRLDWSNEDVVGELFLIKLIKFYVLIFRLCFEFACRSLFCTF